MERVRISGLWRRILAVFAVFAFLCAGSGSAVGKTIHVKAGGAGNGSSWADAFGDLQSALDVADPNDEIWVAEGIYTPTSDYGLGAGERGKHFRMKNGVGIYGGFPTQGDPNWNDRDWEECETVLSGDLLGNDGEPGDPWDLADDPCRADNCYTIFYHPRETDLEPNAVLDGFIITGGSMGSDDRFWFGGGMYNDGSSPTVANCTFIGNSAFEGGGMANSFSDAQVSNCVFSANSSEHGGGGMSNSYSSPTVTNCTFYSACPGGAMTNWESYPVVTDCNFIGSRTVTGGAMAMHNQFSSLIVTNCTFSDNRTQYVGGAMTNYWSGGKVTNCVFRGNSSEEDGGGMYNRGSAPTVTNCSFIGNWTETGDGGGMWNGENKAIITDCNFIGNRAVTGSGGAICNSTSNPTITGCIFRDNSAEDRGGGMLNANSDPVMTNCTFGGNRAEYGGGMYNSAYRTSLSNCIFTDNSADEGGGMYNKEGEQTLVGCLFGGNSAPGATGAGGGMYNLGCTTNLTNCTFGGNAGRFGAAIYVDEGSANLTNCIVWNGPGGYYEYDASATITYSNVQGGWAGIGNIDTDPCFVDPGCRDPNGTPEDANDDFWVDGDYHLKSQAGRWDSDICNWVNDKATSPCIDAGDILSPIGPEPFPNGGVVNMGAYGGTTEASKSYFGKPNCEIVVAGDINGDCLVNFIDFRILALRWYEESDPVPEEAWGPTPEDGAYFVPTSTTLSWHLGDLETQGYTVEYAVYLGTDATSLPQVDIVAETSYDVDLLDAATRYYWRIDTNRRIMGPPFTTLTTPGNIWSFVTSSPIPTGN